MWFFSPKTFFGLNLISHTISEKERLVKVRKSFLLLLEAKSWRTIFGKEPRIRFCDKKYKILE